MSLSININVKRLSIAVPANLLARLYQTSGAVDFIHGDLAGRRYTVVDSSATHTRIAAGGQHLAADDATTPHVVIDHATGLMWSVQSLGDTTDSDQGLPHAECEKRCRELALLGHHDWRLPTRTELASLIDDTRHEPAINTDLFPGVKPRWHWTSTPAAWSSASAWYVNFSYGLVYGNRRGLSGFALAVRRAGQ
jgi:hypothetical protein